MWYRIDFTRFARQLLPPVLRSGILLALLRVLITPLRHLHDRFMAYRDGVSSRLNITAAVQYIEKRLNDEFFLTGRQIFIGTPEDRPTPPFYLKKEGRQGNPFYLKNGNPFFIKFPDEASFGETFIVYVPSFLCTSLDIEADKYKGRNLQIIYNILNFYKPAGRSFRIEIYEV